MTYPLFGVVFVYPGEYTTSIYPFSSGLVSTTLNKKYLALKLLDDPVLSPASC